MPSQLRPSILVIRWCGLQPYATATIVGEQYVFGESKSWITGSQEYAGTKGLGA